MAMEASAMLTLQPAPTSNIPTPARNDITVVCGECGGNGCKKCHHSGTVTIVE